MWCFPCGPSSRCPNKADMPVFPADSLPTLCPFYPFKTNGCMISQTASLLYKLFSLAFMLLCSWSVHKQAAVKWKLMTCFQLFLLCIFSIVSDIQSTVLSTCLFAWCPFILQHFPVFWMAFVQAVLVPPSLMGFVNLPGTWLNSRIIN